MLCETNARSPAPGRAASASVETPGSSWAYERSARSDMSMQNDRERARPGREIESRDRLLVGEEAGDAQGRGGRGGARQEPAVEALRLRLTRGDLGGDRVGRVARDAHQAP